MTKYLRQTERGMSVLGGLIGLALAGGAMAGVLSVITPPVIHPVRSASISQPLSDNLLVKWRQRKLEPPEPGSLTLDLLVCRQLCIARP